jgi:hypothetical protein
MFIDMFHIQIQLMLRLDWWNEYVCIYRRLVLSFGRSKWELDFNTPLKNFGVLYMFSSYISSK